MKYKPARPASPFLKQDHVQLLELPDAFISATYYRTRDEEVQEADGSSRYPHIQALANTPFEREKDRREIKARMASAPTPEAQEFYEEARRQPCSWWLEHHLVAKHAMKSCMYCGVCTSQCPAAEYYPDYVPRAIVEIVTSGEEERIVALLKSDTLWFCGQCGSCKPACPRGNNLIGLISSLRLLAQIKGYHLHSVRGRQQYAARHLWGANFWNRGMSLYFRNPAPEAHRDFGPEFEQYYRQAEEQMVRLGASPDRDGLMGGRKITPETLEELRGCVQQSGTLLLWDLVEEHAKTHAFNMGLTIDEYYDLVSREG